MSAANLKMAISRIQAGNHLSREDAAEAFSWALCGDDPVHDVSLGALLAALEMRGPSSTELAGLVDACRAFDSGMCPPPPSSSRTRPGPVMAMVGSGKDTFPTANISTAAALVAASLGVPVVKPVAAGVNSRRGSADLVNRLGLPLSESADAVEASLDRHDVAFFRIENRIPHFHHRYGGRFLFFHPLSPYLGVLSLPVHVDAVVMGLARPRTAEAVETVSKLGLGLRAALALHCSVDDSGLGCDELLPVGENAISVWRHDAASATQLDLPAPWRNPRHDPAMVEALTAEESPSATQFVRTLSAHGPLNETQEAVAMNAGALLWLAERANSLEEGRNAATAALRQGAPRELLESLGCELPSNRKRFDWALAGAEDA